MRKISVFLLASVFAVSGVFATNTKKGNPTDDAKANKTAIATEVGGLLKAPNFVIDQDINALVTFTINDNNELVILSINTDDSQVTRYLKASLNYKKLKTKVFLSGDRPEYKLPVKIKMA